MSPQTQAELLYKPEAHEYWALGIQVPGITTVLSHLGYNGSGSAFFTQNSRQKGSAVAIACHIADTQAPEDNDIDSVVEKCFSDLHPDIVPYLAGWLLFRREKQYTPEGGEQPMYDKLLRIAGKPDSFGLMRGRRKRCVVDGKTWKAQGARPKRGSELQTAGYKRMLRDLGFQAEERWVVKLPGNGKYRAYLCENPRDEEFVAHAAQVWWDLRNHKLVALSGDQDEEVAAIE